MPEPAESAPPQDIACPFCALGCDDLSLSPNSGSLAAGGNACPRARRGFDDALAAADNQPRVSGRSTTWDVARNQAADILAQAVQPLFYGPLGDLVDVRSALRLAERLGGVVDAAASSATALQLRLFQSRGWITTSLGEARNRADLLVLIGDDLEERLPRLRERLFEPPERLHADAPATLFSLSEPRLETLAQVRALRRGLPLARPGEVARKLSEVLDAARYAVLVLGGLDGEDADLILHNAARLVAALNERGRAALLPLGSGAETGTQACAAWHGGFGLRTSFARGVPEQDLERFDGARLLAEGETDCLVWLSSLDPRPPPEAPCPRIVIGHPAMRFARWPEVYLPVAVPGVHRHGYLQRADGLQLRQLKPVTGSPLTSSAALAGHLLQHLEGAA